MQSNRTMAETKKSSPTIFIDNSFVKGTYSIGDKGTVNISGEISQENIDTDTDILNKTIKITKLNMKKYVRIE